MSGQTDFVQPIALLRAGTHEDAVRAVALASVTAYVQTSDDPAWHPWITRRFAKSVRRARPGPFAQVEALAAAQATVGEARALAFLPTTYDDLDPTVAKMQVAATELPRAGWAPVPAQRTSLNPLVAINEEAAVMSTGKTAAQAAHGLFGWYLRLPAADRATWVDRGQPFDVIGLKGDNFAAMAATALVTIADAGFTEIKPGTETVAVR